MINLSFHDLTTDNEKQKEARDAILKIADGWYVILYLTDMNLTPQWLLDPISVNSNGFVKVSISAIFMNISTLQSPGLRGLRNCSNS